MLSVRHGVPHDPLDPPTHPQEPSAIKSDIMFSGTNTMIVGGTINYQNRTSRGIDILLEWVAIGAFYNSDELYAFPKCHPHTRVAVLDHIMQWVNESESAREDFMLWLFGPAGAGKSAIAKRIAEIAAEKDLLIATFFFSRTSPTRSNKDRLIATLAYQLALSIPSTRSYIENAIEQDPTIFHKNIPTQIDTLFIKPFLESISSTQIIPSKKLIIIDGLDECNDSKAQVAILEEICRSFTQHNLPVKFLVVSRPELSLVTLFTSNEPLKSIHRRLALDDTYHPDDDILLFFTDKFEQIRLTHPLRSTIPISWPTQGTLLKLVAKSSGQFVYASTIVKFVESSCHRPSARLNVILGVSPPGTMKPFAELDAIYNHILSSVDDVQLTLRVLSLYVMTPSFASQIAMYMSPELFLSLEPGDIRIATINLSSILTYDEPSLRVEALHASFVDFLSDKHRSTIFYIDTASTCTDFIHRLLRYVKGPDGIQAGNIHLFRKVTLLLPYIPNGQLLRSDILDFDIDTFINASIKWRYEDGRAGILLLGSTIHIFLAWMEFLDGVGLEDSDKKEAVDQLHKSFELRRRIYQSDWRLQLLVALSAAKSTYYWVHEVPYCRSVDILLEMDDRHDLHLVDQDALDLRHATGVVDPILISSDAYASAALCCMRFLSHAPKYFKRNGCSETGPIYYPEWTATCDMTLGMLCEFLPQANASPELLQFISNHDIHPEVQKLFSAFISNSDIHLELQHCFSVERVWEVNVHLLAFLSRANMCPNWRIISAIQQSLIITRNQQLSNFVENSAIFDEDGELGMVDNNFMRQRLDRCCLNAHYSNTIPLGTII